MIKRLLLYSVLLLLPWLSIAQGIADTTYVLNQVEIKAQRTLKDRCIIKTEIDTLLIQESLNSSLSDLLTKYSPVFIKTYGQGSLATASFRGTAASHTQVEWNGININSPMLGQVDFSLIPVYFIDEVSLFHGGSSLQSSSGALGGSVIINSRPEWGKGLRADIIQSFGSFNTLQSFVKCRYGTEKALFDLRLFYEQSENDFEFYNNANGLWNYENQENADYNKKGAILSSYFRLGNKNFISLNIWGQTSNRNLPSIMSYEGTGRDEYQDDEEIRVSGNWKLYKGNFKSELVSGFSQTKLDYYLANNTPLGVFVNYDTKSVTQSLFNKYSFEYKPSEKTILLGSVNLNFHGVHIYKRVQSHGNIFSRPEKGASLSLHHHFFDRLSAYGLVRGEIIGNSFVPIMPSVGIEYEVLKKHNLYFKSNFTRNYHQPTLNDLYWTPGGNPDLNPERGYTGDIAIDYSLYRDSTFSLKTGVSGYFSQIENWIVWRPSEYRFWQAENVKEVYARGIEYTVSANKAFENLDLGFFANYSFTRTTNQDETIPGDNSVGKQLIYIPEHKANAILSAEFHGFNLAYSYALIGQRYTTSSNEVTRHTLPAYSMHNITFGKVFSVFEKDIKLQFKVNNLMNLDYQAILWRAMPGRNYRIILKIEL